MLPIKVTDKIVLTPVLYTDAAAITSYMQDREVSLNLSRVPYPYNMEDANTWLNRNFIFEKQHGFPQNFAIRNEEGILIGATGLHFNYGFESIKTEFGYWLAKKYWGQGIMTAVVLTLCDYAAKRHGTKIMEATVFTRNPASARVLIKAGFTDTGMISSIERIGGEAVETRLYAKEL